VKPQTKAGLQNGLALGLGIGVALTVRDALGESLGRLGAFAVALLTAAVVTGLVHWLIGRFVKGSDEPPKP
jgi:hypothetical protein